MINKHCPLLRIAGLANGSEACNVNCALYVSIDEECNGCAFEIIARAMVSNANSTSLLVDNIEEIGSTLYGVSDSLERRMK